MKNILIENGFLGHVLGVFWARTISSEKTNEVQEGA